ncbi:DUF4437 domain-containing protein [Ferrimonas marina]|uniref:DUF4437 domain-containing protein n=1 Tax=Ferrimonas marina TaxID=299255 RepID=A0A1M5MSG5_9GAMM|nr:DUF4437 domain-containing protein [Ferrimonas marina]SHG80304.1 protein of unknown function [Ferrimonas marina]
MLTQKPLIALSSLLLVAGLNAAESPRVEVVAAEQIDWGYLNPLRGKLSPGAADLWGDRTTDTATGMLVRFNKGFSSPPHIHNITYRGVVIEGMMHNDDPTAAKMWMPAESFWTQPAGEDHITAADGETNLIYLEIDSGPYLVKPSEQGFDNGERPLNLHANNLVWQGADDVSFLSAEGSELAMLWGSPEPGEMGGMLVKLPADFDGELAVNAEEFRAVVIRGSVSYQSVQQPEAMALAAGSYLGSEGQVSHQLSTASEGATLYIRTNGRIELGQ